MATIDDWFDEQTLMDLVPADVYVRGAAAALWTWPEERPDEE